MNENINISTWANIVQQIGFERALILILLILLAVIVISVLTWVLCSHSRKLDKVISAIYCLKRSFDKMLNIEQIKAEARRDPVAMDIKNIIEAPAKKKAELIDINKKTEKGRLEYERQKS